MRLANAICVAFVVAAPLFGQSQPPVLPQTLKSIEAIMDAQVAEGAFRGNLLVSQNGKVVLLKSYGRANFEWSQSNTADAKFRVGSITKTLTALLVLSLAQDGKLRLDQTISDYLPYYRPDTGRIITIAELLAHSSGLPSFTSLPEFDHSISRIRIPVKEFVIKYCQPDLISSPGTAYHYSNTGYFLLGAIVEAATGKSWAENLRERVLKPMGMTNTDYGQNATILPHFAYGYMQEGCVNAVAPFTEMAVPFSAGGLYSTVEDLNKMNSGITNNTVLNSKYTTMMFTGHISENPPAQTPQSGYGWDISKLPTATGMVELDAKVGQIWGYSNFMIRSPDFFVVLLGNMTEANSGQIALSIIMTLYGAPAPVIAQTLQSIYYPLQRTICTQGLAAGLAFLKNNKPASPNDLSLLGNNFLGTGLNIDVSMNDIDVALALFNANAALFPTVSTVYTDLTVGNAAKAAALSASGH